MALANGTVLTGLFTFPGETRIVGSDVTPLTEALVGGFIQITGGPNWNPGFYEIFAKILHFDSPSLPGGAGTYHDLVACVDDPDGGEPYPAAETGLSTGGTGFYWTEMPVEGTLHIYMDGDSFLNTYEGNSIHAELASRTDEIANDELTINLTQNHLGGDTIQDRIDKYFNSGGAHDSYDDTKDTNFFLAQIGTNSLYSYLREGMTPAQSASMTLAKLLELRDLTIATGYDDFFPTTIIRRDDETPPGTFIITRNGEISRLLYNASLRDAKKLGIFREISDPEYRAMFKDPHNATVFDIFHTHLHGPGIPEYVKYGWIDALNRRLLGDTSAPVPAWAFTNESGRQLTISLSKSISGINHPTNLTVAGRTLTQVERMWIDAATDPRPMRGSTRTFNITPPFRVGDSVATVSYNGDGSDTDGAGHILADFAGLEIINLSQVTNDVTVSGVTILDQIVLGGTTKQLLGTVQGSDGTPSQALTWSKVLGATGDTINASGLVSVGVAGEMARSMVVRATSVADSDISDTAIISIPSVTGATTGPALVYGGLQVRGYDGWDIGKLTYTAGDAEPDLLVQFCDEGGRPIDLTGSTVRFDLFKAGADEPVVSSSSCALVSDLLGYIRYTWQSTDLATPGTYRGRFYRFGGGGRSSTGTIAITVKDRLSN